MKQIITFLMLCLSLSLTAQENKSLIDRALQMVQKDSLPQAEKLYKEAIKASKNEKDNVKLYCSMALIQRQMRHFPDAADSYTYALKSEPQSVSILLKRGAIYIAQGLNSTALADYNAALNLQPDNQEALTVRAYILLKRGEYTKARDDYNHLRLLDSNNFDARFGLALLAQKNKDFRSAMEQLNTLISEYENNSALYLARANVEMDITHPDLALIDVERAIALDPNVPEAFLLRGDIHLRLRKKALAKQDYLRALKEGASQTEVRPRLQKCK
jgi:tetratricopeptide (TPR) repeat protein